MEKLDLTKTDRAYYSAKTKPEIVEIPKTTYLSITGKGDPSSPAFSEKIAALYPVAYGIKFLCKAQQNDFTVPKLEGQWWYDDHYGALSLSEAPQRVPRSAWCWRLLIRMPAFVTEQIVAQTIENVVAKKKLSVARETALFTMTEGKVVQMLHVGPFDREPETLKQIQELINAHQFKKAGLHHEVYLSDFNKTPPEKLRTILREPVSD